MRLPMANIRLKPKGVKMADCFNKEIRKENDIFKRLIKK